MNANLIAAVTADGTGANFQGRGKGTSVHGCVDAKKNVNGPKRDLITLHGAGMFLALRSFVSSHRLSYVATTAAAAALARLAGLPLIEPSAPPRIVFGSPIRGGAS